MCRGVKIALVSTAMSAGQKRCRACGCGREDVLIQTSCLLLQVLRVHADVCSGLDHLASMASVLPAPPGLPPHPPSVGDQEQVLEVLAHCEQKLAAAHK